jgi:hypothetical protein
LKSRTDRRIDPSPLPPHRCQWSNPNPQLLRSGTTSDQRRRGNVSSHRHRLTKQSGQSTPRQISRRNQNPPNGAAQTGVYSFYSRFRIYRRFWPVLDERSSSRIRLFPPDNRWISEVLKLYWKDVRVKSDTRNWIKSVRFFLFFFFFFFFFLAKQHPRTLGPGCRCLFLSFSFWFCFCSDGGERGGLTSWPRPGGGNPMYICHGRKAAVSNMKKQTNNLPQYRNARYSTSTYYRTFPREIHNE